jgi:hypothetical protein
MDTYSQHAGIIQPQMSSNSNLIMARQTATDAALDKSTNAASILAINGCFTAAAFIIVIARIYVRTIMLKTFGADDYIIVIATVNPLSRWTK